MNPVNEERWRKHWENAFHDSFERERGRLRVLPDHEPTYVPLSPVQAPRSVRVGKWVLGVAIVALVGVYGYSWVDAMMKAPERERHIEQCTNAMLHGDGSGPIKACEGLDEDGKKQASYVYLKDIGFLG